MTAIAAAGGDAKPTAAASACGGGPATLLAVVEDRPHVDVRLWRQASVCVAGSMLAACAVARPNTLPRPCCHDHAARAASPGCYRTAPRAHRPAAGSCTPSPLRRLRGVQPPPPCRYQSHTASSATNRRHAPALRGAAATAAAGAPSPSLPSSTWVPCHNTSQPMVNAAVTAQQSIVLVPQRLAAACGRRART